MAETTIQKEVEDMKMMVPGGTKIPDFKTLKEIFDFLAAENPGINPTMNEFFSNISGAYIAAANRIEKENKLKLEQQRREQLIRMWTYEEMHEKAMQAGQLIAAAENFKNGFVLDSHNEEAFMLLCLYFTNDPKFEDYGYNGIKYSLKKGIWLQSSVRGSGKSTLLKCFRNNKRCCFGYKHTGELAKEFQKKGFDGIDYFIGTIPQPSSASNYFQKDAGFMYDELFGELKVMHMGSPLLVSEYIISSLYDFSDNKKGEMWKFHCTSNASGEDIEAISGKTYRTRMPDMFNLIKLEGPNRRIL